MMEKRPSGRKVIPVNGWKIRFDAPPTDGFIGRASEGDILSLFRAWDDAHRDRGGEADGPTDEGPGPSERRRSLRYEPAETKAWVGWWRHGHFLVTRAEFVNLSRGGALMRLAQKPPTSQPVWVCLGTPAPVDSVQARVLEALMAKAPSVPTSGGSLLTPGSIVYVSRLEFHAPCPGSFFEAAGRDDRHGPRRGGPTPPA